MKGETCKRCYKLDFINGRCERHGTDLEHISQHVYRRCAACLDSAKNERKGTAIEFSVTSE